MKPDKRMRFREVSPAIELECWVALGLTPMLRLVFGPPVTDDQAIIQMSLLVLAALGAVGLRLYSWLVSPPQAYPRFRR